MYSSSTRKSGIQVKNDLPSSRGSSISRLITDRCFIGRNAKIGAFAEMLSECPEVRAVGVVDEDETVMGIIVKEDLFKQLGRPYGLDVFQNRSVDEVMQPAQTFHCERNIFSVADEIGDLDDHSESSYFLLVDEYKRFAGIFSSFRLLCYLSRITKRDIQVARDLQQRIAPEQQKINSDNHFLVLATRMAKGVGGDFNFIKDWSDRLFFAVLDVSGKGMGAALVTASLWTFFGTYRQEMGLTDFIESLNDYLYDTFESRQYVTGMFFEFDKATRRLRCCDMGHGHGYIHRSGKLFSLKLSSNNIPMGIKPSLQIASSPVPLKVDDILLIATDGLLEQVGSNGSVFSIDRVNQFLINYADNDMDVLCDTILDDFYRFRGYQSQHDDISLGLFSYRNC